MNNKRKLAVLFLSMSFFCSANAEQISYWDLFLSKVGISQSSSCPEYDCTGKKG